MYALSRGPSKIVASTRRGTRAFDLYENSRDQTERVDSDATMSSVARPIFNHNHNGRMRNNQPRANSNDGITYMNQSHQEAAQFLRDSWNKILRDMRSPEGGPEVYRQREPHPAYENFKKLDLDDYYGKKTMRRITDTS